MSQWLQVDYGGAKTYIQVSHIQAIRPGDTPDYCIIATEHTWFEVPHSVDSILNAVIGPEDWTVIPSP